LPISLAPLIYTRLPASRLGSAFLTHPPGDPQMSSSRDYPFTFSPNLRDSLGTPDRLNTEIRTAFPSLFDNSIKSRLTYVNDNLLGPGVMMRHSPQPPLPAGTPIGLFAGHVTLDWHRRDATTLPLPTIPIHGVEVHLSIHASALMRRSPSPITAALFNHHCNEPTLHSTWWLDGQGVKYHASSRSHPATYTPATASPGTSTSMTPQPPTP
jgi:hypothetical protein